jgi:hypothetical protein
MDKLYTPISIKNLTETPNTSPDNDYNYLYFKNGNLAIKDSNGVESQTISFTGTTVNISGDSSNNMVLNDITGSYCLCDLGGSSSSFGWSGSTSNAVGTYVDSGSVCAEPNLTFDGSTLGITGGVSASGNITGATVCGTTSVRTPIVCTSTCVRSPVVCGVTSVNSPIVYGSSCACSQVICGVTCVIGATLCASSIIHSPIFSGSTRMCSPFICGTSSMTSPNISASVSMIAPQICGSTCICSPAICGTSCVRTGIVCSTTCVRTSDVVATSNVYVSCLNTSGLYISNINKCTVTTTSSTNYTYTPVARPDSCIFYCSTTDYINSCLFIDLDNYEIANSHACFHLHTCRVSFNSLRYIFRNSLNVEFFCVNALDIGLWNYDVDIHYNGSSFDVLHAICSCFRP